MTEHNPNNLPVPSPSRCLNCNARLAGEYCAHCGQHTKHHVHSAWAVAAELIEDLFHADHRLWRTLVPLLLRPGELTVEYLRGRRVHYTPPLRLYIALSLVFFLSISLTDDNFVILGSVKDTASVQRQGSEAGNAAHSLNPDAGEELEEFLERIEKDERAEVRARIESSLRNIPEDEQLQVVKNMSNPCSPQLLGKALPGSLAEKERLLDTCRSVTADNGKEFFKELGAHVPQMMFFFLPLIAVFGKLLYIGSRRYYVEHLLFFVHYHSFFFLALSLKIVAGWLLDVFDNGWLDVINGLLITVVVFYIPIYLYKAMRRVYAQGRLLTSVKLIFLSGAYLFSLLLTFVSLAAYTALTLKS